MPRLIGASPYAPPMRVRAAQLEPEAMDAAAADPAALRRALRFIRRINQMLGYNTATIHGVRAFFGVEAGSGIGRGGSLLDVCCGSADLLERWEQVPDVLGPTRYVGLDFHATTLAVAHEWRPGATLVRGDALRLPFADNSFDVTVCQMALHHFDADGAATILREMDRVSRRGWVVADLLRRRRALAWITLFSLFASPMVRHDARTSVRQGWRRAEVEDLCKAAGVAATYRPMFGHRFMLVGRKT